jgi:hypothetical protein
LIDGFSGVEVPLLMKGNRGFKQLPDSLARHLGAGL